MLNRGLLPKQLHNIDKSNTKDKQTALNLNLLVLHIINIFIYVGIKRNMSFISVVSNVSDIIIFVLSIFSIDRN